MPTPMPNPKPAPPDEPTRRQGDDVSRRLPAGAASPTGIPRPHLPMVGPGGVTVRQGIGRDRVRSALRRGT